MGSGKHAACDGAWVSPGSPILGEAGCRAREPEQGVLGPGRCPHRHRSAVVRAWGLCCPGTPTFRPLCCLVSSTSASSALPLMEVEVSGRRGEDGACTSCPSGVEAAELLSKVPPPRAVLLPAWPRLLPDAAPQGGCHSPSPSPSPPRPSTRSSSEAQALSALCG